MIGHIAERLNYDQLKAVHQLATFADGYGYGVHGLFGPAGTGKSTVLGFFASTEEARTHRIVFAAPTHKAALVLEAMADRAGIKALSSFTTAASLIGATPRVLDVETGIRQFEPLRISSSEETGAAIAYDYSKAPIATATMVVVDECSMLNQKMVGWILDAARLYGVKVIFVGDSLQLPPVTEEALNGGMSCAFTEVEAAANLTTVERSSGGLTLYVDSVRRAIGSGTVPAPTGFDSVFTHSVKESFIDSFMQDPDNSQIIAYRNEVVDRSNAAIRQALFGDVERFVRGDRIAVMDNVGKFTVHQQLKITGAKLINSGTEPSMLVWHLKVEGHADPLFVLEPGSESAHNDEVFELLRKAKKSKSAVDWKNYYAEKDRYIRVKHGYAQTIHASQGSTYNRVFVHAWDARRIINSPDYYGKMMYVACSRASQELHLLGLK